MITLVWFSSAVADKSFSLSSHTSFTGNTSAFIFIFNLFIAFAKVGVLTFGGGYAMLPILQREIVEKNNWASDEELMDYYAIGQCTPGVIAVNTETFIGQKNKGILGGIMATLGVVTPSLIIITAIAAFIIALVCITAISGYVTASLQPLCPSIGFTSSKSVITSLR